MAEINIRDEVSFDRERVYQTFRDRLAELLPYLPDVEDIQVQDREEVDGNTLKVVNLWKAKAEEIPRLAQAFVKPEMLRWTDHATWHDQSWSCDWDMEVGFLKEAITCRGTTRYEEVEPGKTVVTIQGELKVDARKIPGVPRLGAGKIGDVIESFVVRLISPNLTNANRGVERFLAEHGED